MVRKTMSNKTPLLSISMWIQAMWFPKHIAKVSWKQERMNTEDIKSENTKFCSNSLTLSKYNLHQRKPLGAPVLVRPNVKAIFSEHWNEWLMGRAAHLSRYRTPGNLVGPRSKYILEFLFVAVAQFENLLHGILLPTIFCEVCVSHSNTNPSEWQRTAVKMSSLRCHPPSS